jgi:hypothetical protein
MTLLSPFDLPNKQFLDNLLDQGEVEPLLSLLENHCPFLEFVSKYERHIEVSKFVMLDRIEQLNDLAFVAVSDSEFIVKFFDKQTPLLVRELDRRSKLPDSISIRLWTEGEGFLAWGKNFDSILQLFYHENESRYPGKIDYSKGVVKIGYSNAIEMVAMSQLFFSFVLTCYQIWKLFVIMDFRNKRFEGTQSYDNRDSRRLYQFSGGKPIGFGGENGHFKFGYDQSVGQLLYLPKTLSDLTRQAEHHGTIRVPPGVHPSGEIRYAPGVRKYIFVFRGAGQGRGASPELPQKPFGGGDLTSTNRSWKSQRKRPTCGSISGTCSGSWLMRPKITRSRLNLCSTIQSAT